MSFRSLGVAGLVAGVIGTRFPIRLDVAVSVSVLIRRPDHGRQISGPGVRGGEEPVASRRTRAAVTPAGDVSRGRRRGGRRCRGQGAGQRRER